MPTPPPNHRRVLALGHAGVVALAAAAALASCDVVPLTRAQLYGVIDAAPRAVEPADAADAAPAPDLAPDLPAGDTTGPGADTAPAVPDATPDVTNVPDLPPGLPACSDIPPQPDTPVCDPQKLEAFFGGVVVDACEPNVWIDANVSLGSQRLCSGRGKGSYNFSQLPAGCQLTLVAAKPGYQPYCAKVAPPRAGFVIPLQRVGGCAAPRPVDAPCVCTDPGCIY